LIHINYSFPELPPQQKLEIARNFDCLNFSVIYKKVIHKQKLQNFQYVENILFVNLFPTKQTIVKIKSVFIS